MNIKPIETTYKGWRFRSRTEARWAVCFDSLGLKWEYERDGYDLGQGLGWYLPDFHLPSQKKLVHQLEVEIKGELPTQIESQKAQTLSNLLSLPVIILAGVPGDHAWFLYFDKYSFSSLKTFGNRPWWVFAGIKTNDRDVDIAYTAAKSARFEHGEHP